mgnify:CR=1 FL=1
MPVHTKKVDGYQNRTPGGVKAKGTTKAKADAQARLLRGIEHSPEFRKRVRLRAYQKMSG